MQIVTTPTVAGHRVTRSIGLASGEAILGANIFRDLFAGIRDIVGGRSAAYEQELRKAKAIALEEMAEQACDRGANAVVSVDLDYETIQVGQGGGMLMVSASGTAVLISPEESESGVEFRSTSRHGHKHRCASPHHLCTRLCGIGCGNRRYDGGPVLRLQYRLHRVPRHAGSCARAAKVHF
jgi:uncharacterized protein YbjQ (UPF0145 family)